MDGTHGKRHEGRMDMRILPYRGLGQLRFGMARDEIRSILGEEVRSFFKGPFAKTATDAFRTLGIHVYYEEGKGSAIRAVFLKPTPKGIEF